MRDKGPSDLEKSCNDFGWRFDGCFLKSILFLGVFGYMVFGGIKCDNTAEPYDVEKSYVERDYGK